MSGSQIALPTKSLCCIVDVTVSLSCLYLFHGQYLSRLIMPAGEITLMWKYFTSHLILGATPIGKNLLLLGANSFL